MELNARLDIKMAELSDHENRSWSYNDVTLFGSLLGKKYTPDKMIVGVTALEP